MKRLIAITLLLVALNASAQINLASYNSMYARIEADEGWAATDLFTFEFYSETWLLEPYNNVYRSRPGFQATLVFYTGSHGLQTLALMDWFKPNDRIQAEFKLWEQTATARCRVVRTTHNNGVVNVKIVGLETLKYKP